MSLRPELDRLVADGARRDDLKRRQCAEVAYAALELSFATAGDRGRLARASRVLGTENLDAALAEGNGAILYSLHLCGVFTLVAALSALGHRVHVFRHAPPGQVDEAAAARARQHDRDFARAVGCGFLWMEPENFGVAVSAANALRRNEMLLALIDKPYSRDAVEVELLGGRTLLQSGHAVIARRTGTPLLDVFAHRGARAYPLVVELGEPHAGADDIPATVRECASRLEAHVRRHPEGWYA